MSIIRILFQFVDYIFVYVLWSQYEENGLQGEKYWLRPWTVKLEILGLRHFPTVGRFWKFLLLSKPIGFLPHHLHPTDSRWEQRQVDSVGPSPLGTRRGQLVSPTAFSPAPAPSWFQFSSFLFFLSLCWTFVYYGKALVFRNYDCFAFTHKPSSQLGKMKNKNTPAFYLAFGKMGWINHFYTCGRFLMSFPGLRAWSLRLLKLREMGTYFRICFSNLISTSGKQASGMNLECTFSLSDPFSLSPPLFPSSCYSKIMVWNCSLFFVGWLLVSFFSRLVMNCLIHFCRFSGQKICDFCYFTPHVQSYRCK